MITQKDDLPTCLGCSAQFQEFFDNGIEPLDVKHTWAGIEFLYKNMEITIMLDTDCDNCIIVVGKDIQDPGTKILYRIDFKIWPGVRCKELNCKMCCDIPPHDCYDYFTIYTDGTQYIYYKKSMRQMGITLPVAYRKAISALLSHAMERGSTASEKIAEELQTFFENQSN